jgi:hypothetical protein
MSCLYPSLQSVHVNAITFTSDTPGILLLFSDRLHLLVWKLQLTANAVKRYAPSAMGKSCIVSHGN